MTKIQAIVWDWGGVLVRTEDYSGRDKLAERLDKTRQEIEDLVFSSLSGKSVQLGTVTETQHWEEVRRRLNLNPQEFMDFQNIFWSSDQLDKNLVRYIRDLRIKYKSGLLSNNFPGLRKALKETWKVDDLFDAIVISAEVGLLKPDPRIYGLVLDQLGVAPREAIFIDDFEINLTGAAAVGMHPIHFKNPHQVYQDIQQVLG